MNKLEFLKNFEQTLVELPPNNRRNLVAYYDELITSSINEGQPEEVVIASLDSPKSLAYYHIAEYLLDTAEDNLTTPNIFRVMKITLRLGFSNLVLLVGPILGILGALFALVATSATVILTGLALMIGVFVGPTVFSLSLPDFFYENTITSVGTLFLSIGLIAFGLLFLIGAYLLIRLIYRGTLKHLRFHLLKRKGDN